MYTCREYFVSLNCSTEWTDVLPHGKQRSHPLCSAQSCDTKYSCTMNVPNTLSQYTMNVRLELPQKFKIQNRLTFCVSPNRNKIATKCIVKYFCYDPQKFFFNMVTSHWYAMSEQKHVCSLWCQPSGTHHCCNTVSIRCFPKAQVCRHWICKYMMDWHKMLRTVMVYYLIQGMVCTWHLMDTLQTVMV